jgi:hypothetical protein
MILQTVFLLLVVIYRLIPPWCQSPGLDYNPAKPLRKLHFGPKNGTRTPTLPRFGPPHLYDVVEFGQRQSGQHYTVPLKSGTVDKEDI